MHGFAACRHGLTGARRRARLRSHRRSRRPRRCQATCRLHRRDGDEARSRRRVPAGAVAKAQPREQSILDAMARPAERTKPWREYRADLPEPKRDQRRRGVLAGERARPERVAATDYGVPAEIIVGIIGVETPTAATSATSACSMRSPRSPSTTRRAADFFRAELDAVLAAGARENTRSARQADRLLRRRHGRGAVHAEQLPQLRASTATATAGATSGSSSDASAASPTTSSARLAARAAPVAARRTSRGRWLSERADDKLVEADMHASPSSAATACAASPTSASAPAGCSPWRATTATEYWVGVPQFLRDHPLQSQLTVCAGGVPARPGDRPRPCASTSRTDHDRFAEMRASARRVECGLALATLLRPDCVSRCGSAARSSRSDLPRRRPRDRPARRAEQSARRHAMSPDAAAARRAAQPLRQPAVLRGAWASAITCCRSEGYAERGVASWYGRNSTASAPPAASPTTCTRMTAAHKTLPLPTYARVTNLANGRASSCASTTAARSEGRIIDLSYAAARTRHPRPGHGACGGRAIDPQRGRLRAADGISRHGSRAPQRRATRRPRNGKSLYLQVGAFSQARNAAGSGRALDSRAECTRVRIAPTRSSRQRCIACGSARWPALTAARTMAHACPRRRMNCRQIVTETGVPADRPSRLCACRRPDAASVDSQDHRCARRLRTQRSALEQLHDEVLRWSLSLPPARSPVPVRAAAPRSAPPLPRRPGAAGVSARKPTS